VLLLGPRLAALLAVRQVQRSHVLVAPQQRLERRLCPLHLHAERGERVAERDELVERLLSRLGVRVGGEGEQAERAGPSLLEPPVARAECARHPRGDPAKTLLLSEQVLPQHRIEHPQLKRQRALQQAVVELARQVATRGAARPLLDDTHDLGRKHLGGDATTGGRCHRPVRRTLLPLRLAERHEARPVRGDDTGKRREAEDVVVLTNTQRDVVCSEQPQVARHHLK